MKLRDLYNEIKTNLPSKPDIKVKNPDYYQQLVDQSNGLSQSQRKYFKEVIDSVKNQDNLATQRQYDILQRIKNGDFKYHSKN